LWLLAGGSRGGAVDVIISGDADLLSLPEYNGTRILSASDYIARMLQET
jgi:predicted nucleic acid-binding protein